MYSKTMILSGICLPLLAAASPVQHQKRGCGDVPNTASLSATLFYESADYAGGDPGSGAGSNLVDQRQNVQFYAPDGSKLDQVSLTDSNGNIVAEHSLSGDSDVLSVTGQVDFISFDSCSLTNGNTGQTWDGMPSSLCGVTVDGGDCKAYCKITLQSLNYHGTGSSFPC